MDLYSHPKVSVISPTVAMLETATTVSRSMTILQGKEASMYIIPTDFANRLPCAFILGLPKGKSNVFLKKKPKIYIPKIEITKRTYGCGFRWWVDRGVVTSWWSMPEHIASSWQGGSHFCNWESGPRKE